MLLFHSILHCHFCQAKTLNSTFIALYFPVVSSCTNSVKDLSNEAKERIINIYVALDNKLEAKSPRYKEKIATTSKTISKNVINEAKNIKDKIKEEYKEAVGEEAYNNTTTVIEDDIKRVKENALPTVNTIKEKSHDAYVEVKDTLNNWYQEFKESGD